MAASRLSLPHHDEQPRLYRGDGRGGSVDVAEAAALHRVTLPMGADFGDLDGDVDVRADGLAAQFAASLSFCLAVGIVDAVRANEMARRLGRRGGRARAGRLSAERRRQIASQGGVARRRSLLAAKRIAENFRYVAAVVELQGGPLEITRVKHCDSRLPGLYPDRS